jgi:hypothetical protein
MKLNISTTLALILCIVLSVGASTPSDNDGAERTNDLTELLSKRGTGPEAEELTEPDSANLRGGRKLASKCSWKGKRYPHGKWVYDCDAKYDKCQCKCDSWGGGCKWKNCRDDEDYCGWDDTSSPTGEPTSGSDWTDDWTDDWDGGW